MRIGFAIKNIYAGLGGFFISTLMAFVLRIVFLNTLGLEYLGLNGLLSNILAILSVAELGIGTSILYSLYKPVAENNTREIQALMNFYKKVYRILGSFLLLIGLILLPFIGSFIKDNHSIPNVTYIYLLILFNSVLAYFYAYKRSIINANQKNYIVVIISNIANFVYNLMQIVILLTTGNFILVLVLQILKTLVENIIISKKADKMFPFIKSKNNEEISKESLSEIIKNIKGVIFYRVGTAVTNGTDNIIISSFIGIRIVGIYNNYLLITSSIIGVLNQVFNSMTASIGNLAALESKEKQYFIFNVLFLLHFWIYGFSFISLFVLLNPFISLWLGNDFLLNQQVVLVIALNFYLWGIQGATNNFRVALGLFWHGRYRPIIASLINLVTSIILVQYIGLIGVFIGTAISIVSITLWFDPIVVHKYGFKKSSKSYFLKYIKYSIILLISSVTMFLVTGIFEEISILSFIVKVILCLILINMIFYTFFRKTEEFKYLKGVLKSFFKRK